MKGKLILLVSVLICLYFSFPSSAADWQRDDVGWWYKEDGGSYPANAWKEIEGKWYYFNSVGYLLINTITPDGYRVGSDGAWITIDKEQVYAIVSEFLIENGTTGYWLLDEDDDPQKATIWEHWRTGAKGKITVYLDTGDCYEEAPYWGVDMLYPDIPLETNYLFNIYTR